MPFLWPPESITIRIRSVFFRGSAPTSCYYIKRKMKILIGTRLRVGCRKKKTGPTLYVGLFFSFESAWRRYTKHSRNKAQEIQGAVVPLAMTHKSTVPFLGAILAGVFTGGAITQLCSLGFTVLYFTYDDVIKAFKTVGIDASFDESISDSEFTIKVAKWEKLSGGKRELIYKALVEIKNKEIEMFVKHLETTITAQNSYAFIIMCFLFSMPYLYVALVIVVFLGWSTIDVAYTTNHAPSPFQQQRDGIPLDAISCNAPRDLYIRDSSIPLCLNLSTYTDWNMFAIVLAKTR